MAVSTKPRKPRKLKPMPKEEALNTPPAPDYELEVRESIAKEVAARDKEINDLQTKINAQRIARQQFLKGIVMSNADIPEEEETVFEFSPPQKKIMVFKKSTLVEYQQKAKGAAPAAPAQDTKKTDNQ